MHLNIKKLAFGILVLFNTLVVNAKDEKTLALFVTGQGTTFEEAKSICFRNAIEQAFGVFISSKTEILNDDMIKDEIISTSSGNIQSYDIISQIQLKSGTFLVNMNVVVSKSQLISFCSKKAISIEFDGTSLAASARLNNIYQVNELKVVKNLEKQFDEILAEPFEFKLSYKLPKVKYGNNYTFDIPIDIDVVSTDNFTKAINYIFETLEGVSLKINNKEATYDQNVINCYFLDFNKNQKVYYFRNEYVMNFVSALSIKIRNKVSDFNLYLNEDIYMSPTLKLINNYNGDLFFISRNFQEGYNYGDIGLFSGGFDKSNESEVGTFKIQIVDENLKLSYFSNKCLGFYTAFPSTQQLGLLSAKWRTLAVGEISNCFFPFSKCLYQNNSRKPYVLFSVVIENKNNIIAKHKIDLKLGLSQLESIKKISIKPANKL
jgi:hypothetical protein